jgi:hypothetical protein
MRETLNLIRTAAISAVIAQAAACGSASPAPEEPVPKALIPFGYQQKECHFDPVEKVESESDGAGFGGGASNAMGHADTGGHSSTRPFHCHHSVGEHQGEKCLDDAGVEHPIKMCEAQEATRQRE